MKIILSRKGFDSANGGIVSPIFEDGAMISFPIPSNDVDSYDSLYYNGVRYSQILHDLRYKGGDHCHVDPDLKALSLAMHAAGKPQGFICIAPAMLPKIFDFPLRLTIGTDIDTAEIIEDMGGEHVPCPVDDIVVDEDNKIITTPAYMLAQNIAEAAAGIEKLVDRVLVLTE